MALTSALTIVQNAVAAAINDANVPSRGQVIIGWPLGEELQKTLALRGEQHIVSIWPLPGSRKVDDYALESFTVDTPPSLIATVLRNVVTFSGAVAAGINVYGQIAPILPGAHIQASAGDTLASIAAAFAAAINALAYSGITASANGAAVTVAGARVLKVNVAGSSVVTTEVQRVETPIQVTTWAQDPLIRGLIHDAITTGVGTKDRRFPVAGQDANLEYARDSWNDDSQSTYGLYQSVVVFLCEYAILRTATATQIDAIILADAQNGAPAQLTYFGGTP